MLACVLILLYMCPYTQTSIHVSSDYQVEERYHCSVAQLAEADKSLWKEVAARRYIYIYCVCVCVCVCASSARGALQPHMCVSSYYYIIVLIRVYMQAARRVLQPHAPGLPGKCQALSC